MAQNLGMRVVAEGVETDEQLQFLVERRCDEVQGFLVSRPLGFEEFGVFLGAYSGRADALLPEKPTPVWLEEAACRKADVPDS